MRRLLALLIAAVLLAAGLLAWPWLRGGAHLAPPVPAGDPEVAWIHAATSRAVALARALADETDWHGPAPLLLITTATANRVAAAADGGPADLDQTALMDLYPGRSFRFCFTNQQMAQAVVDFLWSQPDLR